MVPARLLLAGLGPQDAATPHWVAVGPASITVLAAAQILRITGAPAVNAVRAVRAVITGLAVIFRALASCLIPPLIGRSAWRHLHRYAPLRRLPSRPPRSSPVRRRAAQADVRYDLRSRVWSTPRTGSHSAEDQLSTMSRMPLAAPAASLRTGSRPPGRLDALQDMQKFSLEALGHELLERAAAAGGGHTADTVVGGHERVLRQTVIAMLEGAVLAEHENPGEATVHVLRGRVRLSAGEQSWEGGPVTCSWCLMHATVSRRWRPRLCC